VEADIIVSLQNTSVRYKNKAGLMVINVVYYHQTLPLEKRQGLMGSSIKMWLYRHFYPFFVCRNNASSRYVVQLPYIKRLFCERFRSITPDRVAVIRPNVPRIRVESIEGSALDGNVF
jgi:hypothetical protein